MFLISILKMAVWSTTLTHLKIRAFARKLPWSSGNTSDTVDRKIKCWVGYNVMDFWLSWILVKNKREKCWSYNLINKWYIQLSNEKKIIKSQNIFTF